MAQTISQEQAIFEAARAMPPGGARQDYLQIACAGDATLQQRVQSLLAAYDDSEKFLESPLHSLRPTPQLDLPPAEQPGATIGPYKLLEIIGEGGMGIVYRAEQTEPVARQVALKIIKAGLDTRHTLARFDAERQALAMMDHPNIAKVLDAGTTGVGFGRRTEPESPNDLAAQGPARQAGPTGRPYFVMELVQGTPITKYCDQHQLNVRQRLELMISVCQAIQHAHQKGIIHRDIKPTNVLVAEYDGHPVPKVIDFGVAKATLPRSATEGLTAYTLDGQIIGTLEYMSPEQADLDQLDIDTRSDIYSLGVLLYELLTGVTPFDKQHFRAVAFHEMLRIIREEEPEKPSTRLSRSGLPSRTYAAQKSRGVGVSPARPKSPQAASADTGRHTDTSNDGGHSPPYASLASIAAVRSTEPARLAQTIRGELDWIVMKALDKDNNRRYDTASGLALDLQCYLDDQPVAAGPPSATYRFRKFLGRHRERVVLSLLASLLAAFAVGLAFWHTQRVEHLRIQAAESDSRIRAAQSEIDRTRRASHHLYRRRFVALDFPARSMAFDTSTNTFYWVAADSADLLWGQIIDYRLQRNGSIPSLGKIDLLTAGNGCLFWKDATTSSLLQASISQGHCGPLKILAKSWSAKLMAVSDGHIYWIDENSQVLKRARIDDDLSSPEILEENCSIVALAVFHDKLYWHEKGLPHLVEGVLTDRGLKPNWILDANCAVKHLACGPDTSLLWVDQGSQVLMRGFVNW